MQQYIDILSELKSQGQFRQMRECSPHDGAMVTVDGRELVNLSSNDYLGLATDEAFVGGFEAVWPNGAIGNPYGACSSRLLAGNGGLHVQVEQKLAGMYGRAALFFNSGYHANMGILPAMAGKDDLILSDKLVHASIIDGIRLSTAQHIRYRHLDYDQLRTLLRQKRHQFKQVFIVTESIFSMDGDTADLRQLVEIKNEFDALLYVDEAHAVGVRGANGLGLAEEQQVLHEIDLLVGTMGKAWASVGAFVVCGTVVYEWLVNKCRTLIFTTALPPVNMAWTLYVLQQNSSFAGRRQHLAQLWQSCAEQLAGRGFNVDAQSHIIPVMVGDNQAAVDLSAHLRAEGFFVLPIRPPTVPQGTARLRLSLSANLAQTQISGLIERL